MTPPTRASLEEARVLVDKFQRDIMHSKYSVITADDDDMLVEAIARALDGQRERDAKVALSNGADCVCGESIAHAIRQEQP